MIAYVIGDATEPATRPALIVHVVNDINRFGSGFAGCIAQKWPVAKATYHAWAAGAMGTLFSLGYVQLCPVAADIAVLHMCAQHGVRSRANTVPLDLHALACCLHDVAQTQFTYFNRHSIHMPRIGAGLAGGRWADIEPLIQQHLGHLSVTVYDLP